MRAREGGGPAESGEPKPTRGGEASLSSCLALPCFGLQRRQSTLDGATAGSSLGWAATNLDVAAGREAGWAFEGVEWK